MSRIGDLQDFLDAVGPHQPAPGRALPAAAPPAPIAAPDELVLEPAPVTTGLGNAGAESPPVEFDAVTAVTRFPPR